MDFRILIFALLIFLASTKPTTWSTINGIIINNGMATINGNNKMTIACNVRHQIIRQTLSSEGVLTQFLTENTTISEIAQNGSIAVLNNTISGTTRVVEVVEARGPGASEEINVTKHPNGTSQLTIRGWSGISVTEKYGCKKINGIGSINMGNYPDGVNIFGRHFNGK